MSEHLQACPGNDGQQETIQRVTSYLEGRNAKWSKRPGAGDYRVSRDTNVSAIEAIHDAVRKCYNGDREEAEEAYEQTRAAIDEAHDIIGGEKQPSIKVDRVFAVPRRGLRDQADPYSSEITHNLPLLDPKYGVGPNIALRAMYSMPPMTIETCTKDPERTGAIVFVPLFGDMKSDLFRSSDNAARRFYMRLQANNIIREKMDLTASLTKRLGKKDKKVVLGLGALLPALTNYGQTIEHHSNVVTTTGHGGTVHLLAETVSAELARPNVSASDPIGIMGAAGSIGYSSLDVLAERLPEARFAAIDSRETRLAQMLHNHSDAGRITQYHRTGDVLTKSKVIVAAITSRIDLDEIDPRNMLDLTDKVFVDDSQPGAFDREQVERRGGRLRWVVGKVDSADSETSFLGRDHGYNYGATSGLLDKGDVWGCEAEAAVVAASGEPEKYAIRKRVDPEAARRIGELMSRYGVVVAAPQSYGKAV
ncbi:hypothetical protein CR983_03665 [Candidatus Saccharibacteria bacterium]|nr:MAG: hypothetical protein CR983_03665 [Candidatus Saccharibacteria bacterium]